jgi:hypothetical protein
MDIVSHLHMERVLTVVPTRVASVAAIHCVPLHVLHCMFCCANVFSQTLDW